MFAVLTDNQLLHEIAAFTGCIVVMLAFIAFLLLVRGR